MSLDRSGDVVHYSQDTRAAPYQAEQVQRLIAEASRVNGNQPVVINLQLPAEQTKPVRERRDIDWVSIAYISAVALVLILAMSFLFVGCMSQPAPPAPPVVHKSTPSCLFLC
jgi:hypothetical protein